MIKRSMPQRTKAQKLAAEERREKITYSLPIELVTETKMPVSSAIVSEYPYLIADLKRLIFLAVIAFGVEIILWFVLKN